MESLDLHNLHNYVKSFLETIYYVSLYLLIHIFFTSTIETLKCPYNSLLQNRIRTICKVK